MRLGNRMIVMALATFGPVMLIERLLVFAAVKQTGVGRVAKTATPAYLRDARWAGSVVAVAGIACRGAYVTAHEQCASMHAVAILGELRYRERRAIRARKSGHSFRIGMAGATCLGHSLRVHFRLRIFRRTNTMNAMAAHTRRCAVVVFVEQRPAVRAVLKLCKLIGRQRGIEVMHHLGIGMATRAKLNDPGAVFLAIFLRPFLDKIVAEIGRGIAAMTTSA